MSLPLFPALAEALASSEIDQKQALTAAIESDWLAGRLNYLDDTLIELDFGHPQQPEFPLPIQKKLAADGERGLQPEPTYHQLSANTRHPGRRRH